MQSGPDAAAAGPVLGVELGQTLATIFDLAFAPDEVDDVDGVGCPGVSRSVPGGGWTRIPTERG